MLLTGGALSAPRTMPLLPAAQDTRPVHTVAKMASTAGEKKGGIDIALIAYFALWYLGNYYYNISNKMALKAAGGAAGFPLTIATLQLGVGVIYALFLWAAPDARSLPTTTKDDVLACIPVAFCSAAAHSFSVFALSAGTVSFGQIVKAAEPAFAALLGVTLYKKKVGLFVHWIQTPQRSILTPHARISRLRAAASSPSRFLPLFPCLSSLTATPIISPPRSPLFPALSLLLALSETGGRCSVVAVGRARSCVTPTPIFPSGAARTHTQCSAQVSKGKWLCLIPVIGGTSLKLPVARIASVADRASLPACVPGKGNPRHD